MDDTEKNNIITLPDNLYFWCCSLCGVNIRASMKDGGSSEFPAVFTTQDKSPRRFVFCAECTKTKPEEINQYVASEVIARNSIVPVNFSIGASRLWKQYESDKENSFGEKIRVTAWQSNELGILSALTLAKDGKERLLGYHNSGMTRNDFAYSMRYINSYYKKDYGEIKEKSNHRYGIKDLRQPIFKCFLLGTGSDFSLFEDFSLKLGSVEFKFSREEFCEFIDFYVACGAFIKTGIITKLEEFKAKRVKRKLKYMKKVDLSLLKKRDLVASANLSQNRSVVVRRSTKHIFLEIGFVKVHVDLVDFLDCSNILEKSYDCLNEKVVQRRNKAVENLRTDRYLRLNNYVSISYEFIMKDLGWFFGFGDFVNFV